MTKTISPWPLAFGIALTSVVAVVGHGGATGVVGERMMGMMMLGEQVQLLAPVASGEPVEPKVIQTAADMISMHSGSAMTNLFPEGSLDAPTEARPEIWARWQEFSGLAQRLSDLGDELGSAAVPPAPAAPPSPVQALVSTQRSEWERMSFASLMGLAPVRSEAEVDPTETGAIAGPPATRPVAEIYGDITRTCASCHAAFRQ